ncbi:putative Phytocyanin domain, cupredoxin [Helianthus annuus]|nr:putative Phytocyanin domain, cupredoxin [Helianthus annuus]KAJ0955440.1 putative Phytocyanin domain, cupredoxin [Helianthus annuus]
MRTMIKTMMVVAVVTTVITAAMGGEVYTVGDKAGWTSVGHVDYKTWASSKLFQVGDTIVFRYNEIFHDVARVSYTDFITCNGSKPYTTFTSGNDSFPIKYPGHYFFICTQSTHCQTGQKVDIRVPVSGAHDTPQPIAAGVPAPLQPLPFPYPQPYVPVPAPAPAPVTPSLAPGSHSSAPVPHSHAPAPQSLVPVPSVDDESLAPTKEVPAPEIAPAQQKNMGGQLGFGFEIWSMMVVVFYLFGFGF